MAPALETIEAALEQLTMTEQLVLLERLASRIRSRTLRGLAVNEHDLTAMADDPSIQRELRQIQTEFCATEADGLDRA